MLKSVEGELVVPLYEICRGRRQGSVYLITELYDMITNHAPVSLVDLLIYLDI